MEENAGDGRNIETPSPNCNSLLDRIGVWPLRDTESQLMRYRTYLGMALFSLLSGCGVLTTTVVAAGTVVATATDLAVDGAVLVGKGIVKAGEVVADAAKGEDDKKKP